jgi:hypothetical protein
MLTAIVIALICSHAACIAIGAWGWWHFGSTLKHGVSVAEKVITDAETTLRGGPPR